MSIKFKFISLSVATVDTFYLISFRNVRQCLDEFIKVIALLINNRHVTTRVLY